MVAREEEVGSAGSDMARWHAARPRAVDKRSLASLRFCKFATLALLLCGIATQTPLAAELRPVRSLLEKRQDHVIIQGFDLSCGGGALATLLNYQYGDQVSEREIALGLIQREEYLQNPDLVKIRGGFSLLDLKRYVEPTENLVKNNTSPASLLAGEVVFCGGVAAGPR